MAEARRRIAEAQEAGGTDLNLRRLGLTALPPEIAALTALKYPPLIGNHFP
ncbi:MAG: hypothetical protein IID49_15935, partial [Proteobacteria bacterium]|nr:hypothetical protein [Pseudomonadota bacterium]